MNNLFRYLRTLAPYTKPLLLTSLSFLLLDRNSIQNCGIIGYIGNRDIAMEVILQGLEEMQNRGYDSAGAVTYKNGELHISKYASSENSPSDALLRLKSELSDKHKGSYLGLGHTRWATHGEKTVLNAHPHTDLQNRVALIHNGTITNTHEILKILQSKKITPKTETDTELIALMIGLYLDEGHSLKLATRLALQKMNGTWGLAVISRDFPDQIIVARRGSPMLIGLGNKEMFIGSEPSAFIKYTNKFISLDDNEIYKIDLSRQEIESCKIRTAESQNNVSLGKYTHWTLKEIEEQPESISRALNFGARLQKDSARLGGLEEIKDKMLDIQNLVLVGCGTSLFSCMFGQCLFNELGIMNTVQVIDGSEMNDQSIPKSKPGVIAVSQSGETRDVVGPMTKVIEKGVTAISIVNVVSSQLARLTGHGIYMNSGKEVAVASTKSFTNSCVIFAEIALWYSHHRFPNDSERRKKIIQSLQKLPMQAGLVIEHSKIPMQELAQELKNEENLFIIGRGLAESVAKESALKIKELSQLHTEGFSGGGFRTGPLKLINNGVPVIVFLFNDKEKNKINEILKVLTEREAKIIVVTNDQALIEEGVKVHSIFKVEDNGEFNALLGLLPLQLLAYYLSISRGLDPDHPRNLAKVVTVE